MKAPFSWLKDYVDIDVSAQELADKLFSCGFYRNSTIKAKRRIYVAILCQAPFFSLVYYLYISRQKYSLSLSCSYLRHFTSNIYR